MEKTSLRFFWNKTPKKISGTFYLLQITLIDKLILKEQNLKKIEYPRYDATYYIKQSIFEKQTSEISGTFYLLQITLID